MAKFGDIGEFRTGGTPSSSHPEYYGTEYPWITTVALGNTYIDSSDATAYLSNEGLCNSSTKVIDAGSLMIGIRVGVGKCSINNVPMCTSQDIVSVVGIDRSKYFLPFLVAFVNSKKDYFDAQKRGATIKGITTALIKELEIPDITYEEQQRIASVIEGLQLLIDQHNDMLALIDQLVKSRFIEMFGDLANLACVWPQAKLVETCADPDDIKCGPFGTQLSKDEYRNEGIALWEIPQINSQFKAKPTHYLDSDKAFELDAYSIKPGDIAMSRKGNVGRCAVFPCDYSPGIIHSDVLRIRVDTGKVSPVFMMYQLHYSGGVQRQIEQVSSGAIMAGINVTKLKSITVHLPPLDLQEQYAAFIAQTDKSKYSAEMEVAA